jgi:acetyl esterase/lipase
MTLRLGFVLVLILCACGQTRKKPELFYRPPGTRVEIYREDPVSLGINVYPRPAEPVGSVIFIHGGGWSMPGTDMPLFQDWEEPLQAARLQAFSIEHRTAPEYRGKDIVEDCIRAIRYVHENADRFRIPPDRIAVIGFSSGGHLAVMSAISLTRRDPSVPRRQASYLKAVAAFYAPLDLNQLAASGTPSLKLLLNNYLPLNPVSETRERSFSQIESDAFMRRALADISPAENVHPYMPPIALFHGDRDTLVPMSQSVNFQQRAFLSGSPSVVFVPVAGAEHNFNQSRRPQIRAIEQAAVQFILRNLQSP